VSNNPLVYWDPTGHVQQGDETLSPSAQAKIIALTSDWYSASGNTARQTAIHEEADRIRKADKEAQKTASSKARISKIPAADQAQTKFVMQVAVNALAKLNGKSLNAAAWSGVLKSAPYGGVTSTPNMSNSTRNKTLVSVTTTLAGTTWTTSYNSKKKTISVNAPEANSAFWTNKALKMHQLSPGDEWYRDEEYLSLAESQMEWELGKASIKMNNWMETAPNQLRLLQYLVYAPTTGAWDPDTYDALQVQITKFKYSDAYSFSMKRDLFMQLVAQEGKVPQWAKDGDAFLARSGLNDEIKKFNYGMIIYASLRAYENNEVFEGNSRGLVKDGLGDISGNSYAVTQKGIATIKQHLNSTNMNASENYAMIKRLEYALQNGQKITGADASFYLHELKETALMQNGLSYDAAHQMALDFYGASPFSVYDPSIINRFPEKFNNNWRDFWGITK
jgi:hypothetical protein